MRNIIFLCFVLGFGLDNALAQQTSGRWPLDGDIDLSSGFGDYRENRFHAGIDLRTDGQIGKKVFAPVDGYVSRIKTSYFGYGRVLYFKGADGYLYVFGHLSAYGQTVETQLRTLQLAAQRFYVDTTFSSDVYPVKKGDLIAFSGESGAGAPHLHFEKRTADNIPLNPVTHGYELKDKTPPSFTQLGIQLVDDHSLLDNGRRELYLPVISKSGNYQLDTVLYLHSPFGVLAECFDMMNPQGMRQAVYKLSFLVDDTLYYQTVFDSLPYEQAKAAKLEYDYFNLTDGQRQTRRLFHRNGDTFSGSSSLRSGKGVFGLENETFGVKHAKIVAEDASGNKTELRFTFIWGPPHALFSLDSTQVVEPNTTRFFLSPTVAAAQISVDSLAVLLNIGDRWGRPKEVTIKESSDGKYIATSTAAQTATAILQVEVFTTAGAQVLDTIFNGLRNSNTSKLAMSYDFIDGGMLVAIDGRGPLGSQPKIEFYKHDSLLGVVYPRFFTMQRQIAFVPAQSKYSHITRAGLSLSRDSAHRPLMIDSLNIIAIGLNTEQTFSVDDFLTVHVSDSNLYGPQFVELKRIAFRSRGLKGIVSDVYQLSPEKILTKSPIEITYKLPPGQSYNQFTGLCWLDKDKNSWVWIGGQTKKDIITGPTYGGGMFAAVIDTGTPVISVLGLKNGVTYADRTPKIRFTIHDDLSDIEDDRNITVKVDNKWVPAEYDAEKKICTVTLTDPLPDGDNHLAILVTDRAGHLAQHYVRFGIKGE